MRSAAEERIAAQRASWHKAADLWGCHVISHQETLPGWRFEGSTASLIGCVCNSR